MKWQLLQLQLHHILYSFETIMYSRNITYSANDYPQNNYGQLWWIVSLEFQKHEIFQLYISIKKCVNNDIATCSELYKNV